MTSFVLFLALAQLPGDDLDAMLRDLAAMKADLVRLEKVKAAQDKVKADAEVEAKRKAAEQPPPVQPQPAAPEKAGAGNLPASPGGGDSSPIGKLLLGGALGGGAVLAALAALLRRNMAEPNTETKTMPPKKMRGAKPTPRHKLVAAPQFKIYMPAPAQFVLSPAQFILVLTFLEYWLNDTYGICVTAEECFAKAFFSVMNGQTELKITDATELAFANKYNVRDGASLTEVMDKMISDGFHQDGQTYKNGPYASVDYSNESVLQSAICVGPVKIGIDANALPSGAGNKSGWYASGGSPGQFTSEDHCVALCCYGPSAALFQALGVAMPSGFPANGYMLYTWSTVGIVDHAWIMSTCGEAWVRNPTTTGVVPVPPPPPPPPPPPTPGTFTPPFSVVVKDANGLILPLAVSPSTDTDIVIPAVGTYRLLRNH